ncbi:hypothetical protein POTOM_049731 [Populus tomentosa]|uniref:Uncharacterized protein n=1 Tax=Populus tomentosa TaxID=118781 RepID=A0A8X7YF01_POPTO|nr:hypothetical protein POTOM_049731 [Populus tomentosa]
MTSHRNLNIARPYTDIWLKLQTRHCQVPMRNIFLELPSNMVQAKDSDLYKPVLMESYTSPGGFLQNFQRAN